MVEHKVYAVADIETSRSVGNMHRMLFLRLIAIEISVIPQEVASPASPSGRPPRWAVIQLMHVLYSTDHQRKLTGFFVSYHLAKVLQGS
jgi:hypothetical protein